MLEVKNSQQKQRVKNHSLTQALLRQPVDRTPVWIMRQAGRYLPEYRAVREKAGDFMTLCKTPELACEVTMQPLRRFDLDAAILFSDILTIPDAMGLGLKFVAGEGPCFANPIRSAADVNNLSVPDMDADLGYVTDAVRLIKKELADCLPLIGFSGSPWTLACYMIEGGSSKSFSKIKDLMYSDAKLMHSLLSTVTESVTQYLNAQIDAGTNIAMIFDTWGGILTSNDYQEFSLSYMKKIMANLKRSHNGQQVPVVLFTKNGGIWLEDISKSGCDAIGVDWTIDIGQARQRVAGKVALQGNMDPAILRSSPQRIREEVKQILESYGPHDGHVFNLGHGITPDVPPDNVAVLVDAVHELSAKYHKSSDE